MIKFKERNYKFDKFVITQEGDDLIVIIDHKIEHEPPVTVEKDANRHSLMLTGERAKDFIKKVDDPNAPDDELKKELNIK